eukprot:gene11037-14820_t
MDNNILKKENSETSPIMVPEHVRMVPASPARKRMAPATEISPTNRDSVMISDRFDKDDRNNNCETSPIMVPERVRMNCETSPIMVPERVRMVPASPARKRIVPATEISPTNRDGVISLLISDRFDEDDRNNGDERMSKLIAIGCDANYRDKKGMSAIMIAAQEGHMDIIFLLISLGCDVNDKTNEGSSAIMFAAQKGHVDVISLLISYGCDVNDKDNNGWSAFMVAALLGRVNVISLLISHGCDVNDKDNEGMSALMIAAQRGQLDVITSLTSHGCDLNDKNNNGKSAIRTAAEKGHVDAVKLLISHGCDVNTRDNEGMTPIMIAALQGHIDIIFVLTSHGCDMNTKNNKGMSAMIYAALQGHIDIIFLLISLGCNVNDKANNGWSGLMIAVKQSHLNMISLLISHGCDLNDKDNDGESAIMMAAKEGHLDVIALLISHGCDVNSKDNNGRSAIMLAAKEVHLDVVNLLISHGCDVNSKDNDGWSALAIATKEGHIDVVNLLISHGCDVNSKENNGISPIMVATVQGHVNMVSLLISHGCDVNNKDNNGMSAFTYALVSVYHNERSLLDVISLLISNGFDLKDKNNYDEFFMQFVGGLSDIDVISLLISHGYDVNHKDNIGMSAILLAAKDGRVDVTSFLISHGCDVNDKNNKDQSAIMFAALKGCKETVSLLISLGSDVNGKDNDGMSPLLSAALLGHIDVVHLLISQGSDVNDKRNDGLSVLGAAVGRGHEDIVSFLLRHGADLSMKDNEGFSVLYHASKAGYISIQKLLLDEISKNAMIISDRNMMLEMSSFNSLLSIDELYFFDQLNIPKDGFLFDSCHAWINESDLSSSSELASLSLRSKRVSVDYLEKVRNDYSSSISSITHSGCTIDQTEYRGITIIQLQLVMNEIRQRCLTLKDEWKRLNRDGTPSDVTITPEIANLYDILEPIIKQLSNVNGKKTSFVERVAETIQRPSQVLPVTNKNNNDLIRRANAVGFSTGGPLHRDINDHMIISNQSRDGDGGNTKVTVDDLYNNRQVWFPRERIRKAIEFDVTHALASQESDRIHILNAIVGQSDLDAVPPYHHPSYDNLNAIVQAGFASLVNFAIGSKDHDEVTKYCEILSKSNKTKFSFDFYQYNMLDKHDTSLVICYLNSLPNTLTELNVSNMYTGIESTETLFSLPSVLPNLQSLVIEAAGNSYIDVLLNTLCVSIQSSSSLTRLELLSHTLEPHQINKSSIPYRDILAEGCYSLSNLITFANSSINQHNRSTRNGSSLSQINDIWNISHRLRLFAISISHIEVFIEGVSRTFGTDKAQNLVV